MANKTVEEILKGVIKPYDLEGRHHHDWNVPELSISEASRQLFEATMKIIDTSKAVFYVKGDAPIETADSFKETDRYCEIREELREEQRAKARAFYGIAESDGSAE